MTYTPTKIKKFQEDWNAFYRENDIIGNLTTEFICGEQWEAKIKNQRIEKEKKEVLGFNSILKHQNRLETQTDFLTFYLAPSFTEEVEWEQRELTKNILDAIILQDSNIREGKSLYTQGCRMGYWVGKLDVRLENEHSLQKLPFLKAVARSDYCFFDKQATGTFKEDGQFCGERHFVKLTKSLLKQYPELKQLYNQANDKKEIEVVDFYYKKLDILKFFIIEGKAVREDTLTSEELNEYLMNGVEYKEEEVSRIYWMRVHEKQVLTKETLYPASFFPLVFFGFTYRYLKDGVIQERVMPYAYSLIGAQKFCNLVLSQLATLVKDMTGSKVIISEELIEGKEKEWEQFLTAAGVFTVNSKKAELLTEAGQQGHPPILQLVGKEPLDGSLMNLVVLVRQIINDMAGITPTQEGQKVMGEQYISQGVADARTDQSNVILQKYSRLFEDFMTHIGSLIKTMLPSIIEGEHRISHKGKIIYLNSDKEENSADIKEIAYNTTIKIKASLSSAIERKRNLQEILEVVQRMPSLQPLLAPEVLANLNIPNRDKVIRGGKAFEEEGLSKLSEGEINIEEYKQWKQQMLQQQAQQQAQQQDPLMADVEMRDKKNQADIQLKHKQLETNKEIELLKLQNKALQEKDKIQVQIMQLKAKQLDANKQAKLKQLEERHQNLAQHINQFKL